MKSCELTQTPKLPEHWLHISGIQPQLFKNIMLATFAIYGPFPKKVIWTHSIGLKTVNCDFYETPTYPSILGN